MTSPTKRDAIESAMSIADDVAQGRLTPAAVADQAVAELRELFSTVVGPDDLAWPLQLDIARQILALGGVPADELTEWLAVARLRAGEPVSAPDPDQAPPEVGTLPSVVLRPESADAAPELAEADAEPDADQLTDAERDAPPTPAPQRRADGYDPLAGWSPGGSRR